jgi:S-adenosylhomocysteine hydrolase
MGFFFAFSNCMDAFMHLSKKEMKLETNVITIPTQLSSVALKWCITYLHISTDSLFIHS